MRSKSAQLATVAVASKWRESTQNDLVSVVCGYLGHESEIIRCQSALALTTIGDQSVAPVLIEALLDEDPDVRADAMSALVVCARAEDAARIRRSLLGDPVIEVKIAAIQALTSLKDKKCVADLCKLAVSRCEQDVTWDDSTFGWDDWLDLQPAAIEALGLIGDDACVPVLMTARADEMGQNLDTVVFQALARLGDNGISSLLGFLDDADSAVRERSFNALITANPSMLIQHIPAFAQDSDARLRLRCIENCSLTPSLLKKLSLGDSDSLVRAAAISQVLDVDVIVKALEDANEGVRLASVCAILQLDCMENNEELQHTVQQVLNGIVKSDVDLSEKWVELALHNSALFDDALQELIRDSLISEEQTMESRIVAARVLAMFITPENLAALSSGVVDKVQQVRAACLGALALWCNVTHADTACDSDEAIIQSLKLAAVSIIRRAMTGQLLKEPKLTPTALSRDETELGDTVRAEQSPVQWYGQESIALSEMEVPPNSTLDAIKQASSGVKTHEQASLTEPDVETSVRVDELSAHRQDKGKRKRVSVEGPVDFLPQLRCMALLQGAIVDDERVEIALQMALNDSDTDIVISAIQSFSQRNKVLGISIKSEKMLRACLIHSSADVRYLAATLLDQSNRLVPLEYQALLQDADVFCRTLALSKASEEQAFTGLQDSSTLAQEAAAQRLVELSGDQHPIRLLSFIVEKELTDCLRKCIQIDSSIKHYIAQRLREPGLGTRQLMVLMSGLSCR